MPIKWMSKEHQRQLAYEEWLGDIERDHPDCEAQSTSFGCAVIDEDGEIITEYDYDPDPHAEARVRY